MGLQVIKIRLFTDEAMDNTTISTSWVDCSQLQMGSFSFVWSNGSTPVGEVKVFVSNEPDHSDEIELDLSATLAVGGSSGVHVANLDDIPNRYARLKYVGSSGTATAQAWFFGKGDAN
jgi:hypothetical protein